MPNTPPKISIRSATPDDAATIVEFNRRLAWETEQKRLDDAVLTAGVQAALSRPDYARYFVAETTLDGTAGATSTKPTIIGQLMITFEWSDWRNGLFWWIQSVYVHADHRRRGVFRALYDHVETLARATPDVCGLRLYVEHENAAAQATYKNLGMHPPGYVVFERTWK